MRQHLHEADLVRWKPAGGEVLDRQAIVLFGVSGEWAFAKRRGVCIGNESLAAGYWISGKHPLIADPLIQAHVRGANHVCSERSFGHLHADAESADRIWSSGGFARGSQSARPTYIQHQQ